MMSLSPARSFWMKYRRKGADLKQIANRYPESSRKASAQVIFVSENGASYLPPVTQLMATEVQESELNESIRTAKRELRQSALWLEYFNSAKALLDKTKSGETLLHGLRIGQGERVQGQEPG